MAGQLFKLTGRYTINERYKHDVFENTHNVFKLAKIGRSVALRKDYYAYTCFFNIYSEHLAAFRWALSRVVSDITEMLQKQGAHTSTR